jgi:2-isopropylmalate synthase
MAVKTRKDIFPVKTRIETTHITSTSRLVSSVTGFPVQPNKAIVGANAFAHESGIHQDGVLKFRETYEIMSAQDVGLQTNKIVLGKLSGRAAFAARLEELGTHFENKAALDEAFVKFKDLADKKREIYDEDLQALVSKIQLDESNGDQIILEALEVISKTGQPACATLSLRYKGELYKSSSDGDGPVDAAFKAIEKLAKSDTELKLYSVNAVTAGTDSQGEVTVRLGKGGRIVNGLGADTDIMVASVRAYLHALNLIQNPDRLHPQMDGV